MEKQVIFRDRQELQSADINNVETFTASAIEHLISDAVTSERAYTGGLVSAASATEITVAALRFYNAGVVYTVEAAQTLNLFQYLPLVTRKCVAVVVWGQQTDTDVQPRDFLIDLTTGATQPQAVAMQRLNSCNVNLLPGAESADPQAPVIQVGTLAIAYVYLNTVGIDYIEMLALSELPSLANHAARITTVEAWKGVAEPRISSIATDLAGLAQKTESKADRESIIQLANDIKSLKELVVAPAAAVNTTGNYGDPAQAETEAAGYAALVRDAVLFPAAAEQSINLALFNPIDATVSVSADNQVLPAYISTERLKTSGYSGDVAISGYQVQAAVITKLIATLHSQHYGPHANHHAKYYSRHGWDQYGKNTDFETPQFGFIKIKPKDYYEPELATTALNGSILAQTVLVPNAMWLTEVGIFLTQVAAGGDVNIVVSETIGGKPNLSRTLAMVTVAQADLEAYPNESRIAIPPVFLAGGQRYAISVITQGNHRLALVSGGDNTQGTLFYGQDSGFRVHSNASDLMFTLYTASFTTTRTEVMLQAVSLAGGLTDIRLVAQHLIPKGCELFYEIQPTGAGAWYPLGDSTLWLANAPNLVNLRAVMLGTKDLAPALLLTDNAWTVSRSGNSLVFVSTTRVVAETTSVVLSALVHNWDQANHTLTPKIIIDVTEYSAAVTTYVTEDGARRFKYTFNIPATTSYKIKLSGTKAAGAQPFSVVELIDSSL